MTAAAENAVQNKITIFEVAARFATTLEGIIEEEEASCVGMAGA